MLKIFLYCLFFIKKSLLHNILVLLFKFLKHFFISMQTDEKYGVLADISEDNKLHQIQVSCYINKQQKQFVCFKITKRNFYLWSADVCKVLTVFHKKKTFLLITSFVIKCNIFQNGSQLQDNVNEKPGKTSMCFIYKSFSFKNFLSLQHNKSCSIFYYNQV